jgi:transposase-like protein
MLLLGCGFRPKKHLPVKLTLAEREDISREIASGSSIREIARHLDRVASTVSREASRHRGLAGVQPMPSYIPMSSSQQQERVRGPSRIFADLSHSLETSLQVAPFANRKPTPVYPEPAPAAEGPSRPQFTLRGGLARRGDGIAQSTVPNLACPEHVRRRVIPTEGGRRFSSSFVPRTSRPA